MYVAVSAGMVFLLNGDDLLCVADRLYGNGMLTESACAPLRSDFRFEVLPTKANGNHPLR